MIHDSLKAGVYEITQWMSIRQVLELLSNAENAQMNRILVIEGTNFKQLIQTLKKDENVTKTILNLPQDQIDIQVALSLQEQQAIDQTSKQLPHSNQ